MVGPGIGGVTDERVIRRFHSLVGIYKEMPQIFQNSYLNHPILLNCVESYFKDIDRLKQFHKMKRADGRKKAGFTLKWIVRSRPIQMYEGARIDVPLLLANEFFAIRAAIPQLDVDEWELSEEFGNLLLYTLRYRPLDEGVLHPLMYLLERSIQKKSP